MEPIVVIIAYSPNPSDLEIASFKQCLRILNTHSISIACPASLDTKIYREISAKYEIRLSFEYFEDSWFKSVSSYNSLMLNPEFYRRYTAYEYLLLYQLDAWVFADQLNYWCELGYDYIGAPWFTDGGELLPVSGNGGFSLRRVRSFLTILTQRFAFNTFSLIFPRENYLQFYGLETPVSIYERFKKSVYLLRLLRAKFFPKLHFHWYKEHEDYAFAQAFELSARYRAAPSCKAMYFSFERFPEKLYSLTGGILPFGAHAVARYTPEFWAQWISALSRKLNNSL